MQKHIQRTHSSSSGEWGGANSSGTSCCCNLLYNIHMKNHQKHREGEGVRGRAISQKKSSCFCLLSRLCNLSGVRTYLCMYIHIYIPRQSLWPSSWGSFWFMTATARSCRFELSAIVWFAKNTHPAQISPWRRQPRGPALPCPNMPSLFRFLPREGERRDEPARAAHALPATRPLALLASRSACAVAPPAAAAARWRSWSECRAAGSADLPPSAGIGRLRGRGGRRAARGAAVGVTGVERDRLLPPAGRSGGSRWCRRTCWRGGRPTRPSRPLRPSRRCSTSARCGPQGWEGAERCPRFPFKNALI